MRKVAKFNTNLRALGTASSIKLICEMFPKHKIAYDEKLAKYVEEARQKALRVISISNPDKTKNNLAEKNKARVRAVIALYDLIHTHLSVPIAESNELAAPIERVLKNHGRYSFSMDYTMVSGNIASLLGELKSEKFSEAREKLFALDACVRDLERKQEDFSAAYNYILEQEAKKIGQTKLTEAKREMIAYFNNFVVEYVNFMQTNGEEQYEAFAKEIDVVVSEANKSLKSTKGGGNKPLNLQC